MAGNEIEKCEDGKEFSVCSFEGIYFKYSSLAQSVERMTVNHDVVGSSPTRGATIE